MGKRRETEGGIVVDNKNGNGEGSVYQRKRDGMFCAAVVTSDGHRKVFYGKTLSEAKRKRKEALRRIEEKQPVADSKMTVGAWFKQWRSPDGGLDKSTKKRADSTKELYRMICRVHLEPEPFGAIPLDRLVADDIETLLRQLEKNGLSESTRRTIYAVIRAALKDAKAKKKLIAHNPALDMDWPSVSHKEAAYLSVADVHALLKAAESSSRYYPLFKFLVLTGVREGEALSTTWDMIDFENRIYTVPGTKTKKSLRKLPISDALVAMLEVHRDTTQPDERKHAGNKWQEHGFVFPSEWGTRAGAANVLRAFQSAATTAGLEGVTVHSLRHTYATILNGKNIALKTTSTLLGHGNVSTTGDIYTHVPDDAMKEANDLVSQALEL